MLICIESSDWLQLIRCADLIFWLQSVKEIWELQYHICRCANCLVCDGTVVPRLLLHWDAADEYIWAPGVWWGLYFERLVSVVALVERVSMYGVTSRS